MHSKLFRIVALIALLSTAPIVLYARKKPHKKTGPSFAYYMLVLSYAPDFCADGNGSKDPRECGAGKQTGFVVHGLWPQGETTRGPENCGSPGTIPQSTIQAMLQYFPTESLIKHEWQTHGTCSGLSVVDYFAAVKKLRDQLQIPKELTPSTLQTIAAADIQADLTSANAGIPASSFRTSCYPNADLQEIRVCLDKNLSPRACGSSAGSCSATNITLKPVH